MSDDLKRKLRDTLPRDLLLDLYDMVGAQALKAFEMVRDGSGLDERRARELVGQARFRMMEKGFQEVCELHGGEPLPGGIVPGTESRAFQPFMRFGAPGVGIVLGLSSMPDPHELPHKNQSRAAAIVLNYQLTPRLDLGDGMPKAGDIFVLLLVARDRSRPGMIEQIAVGLIDAEYKAYVFYEAIDTFLAGYVASSSGSPPDGESPESTDPLVKLKVKRRTFTPPEGSNDNSDESGASGT